MKRLFLLIGLMATPLFAQNFSTVTANAIEDASGGMLQQGTICFQPVNAALRPTNFMAGGGGVVHSQQVCRTVVNGNMASLSLASSNFTSPVGIQYSVVVTDDIAGTVTPLGTAYICTTPGVTGCQSGTFDLDQWTPTNVTTLGFAGPSFVSGSLSVNGSVSGTAFHGLADASVTSQRWAALPNGCLTAGFVPTAQDIHGNWLNCVASTGQTSGSASGVIAQNPSGPQMITLLPGAHQNIGSSGSYASFDVNGALVGPFLNGEVNATSPIFSGADLGAQIASAAASAYCPSSTCTMVIPAGSWAINANVTTPSTVHLRFQKGATVTIASGITWTINSDFEAGHYQIFAGQGLVSFAANSRIKEIDPIWWGADPTGVSDSTVAWQAALTAAQSINGLGGVVSCTQGTYNISNTLAWLVASTAQGVSIKGTDGQYNGNPSACTLNWTGVAGGTLLHVIGGHTQRMSGLNFAGTGLARAIWYDSTNASSASSSAISSISRSNGVVTVGTATAQTWTNGTDVTVKNVMDPSFDMIGAPVWNVVDNQHFAFIQSGPNASSSGGTAEHDVSGDTLPGLSYSSIFVTPQAGVSASGSISGNVLSGTLATPVIMYQNEWGRMAGCSDPVYNGLWQLTDVTNGGLSFTATATAVTSEASTTGCTFFGPSSAVSLGSNQKALINNSVADSAFDHVIVRGNFSGSNYPLAAFEIDGSGNTKNFSFDHINWNNFRTAVLNAGNGTLISYGNTGALILDSVYALPLTGTATIIGEEEETGGAYFVSNLISGSANAATMGPNGQFEFGALADNLTGTLTLIGDGLNVTSYASTGCAVATTANVTLIGNDFKEVGNTTAIPLICVVTNGNPNTRQAVHSNGNTFANVTNGWIPVAIGTPAVLQAPPGPAVTSNGDMFTDATLHAHPLTYILSMGTGRDSLTAIGGVLTFDNKTINSTITAQGALTFTSIAAGASQTQPLTVTGATTSNHGVSCAPNASLGAGFNWNCWVSSGNTVSVIVTNAGASAATPSAVTWGATVTP